MIRVVFKSVDSAPASTNKERNHDKAMHQWVEKAQDDETMAELVIRLSIDPLFANCEAMHIQQSYPSIIYDKRFSRSVHHHRLEKGRQAFSFVLFVHCQRDLLQMKSYSRTNWIVHRSLVDFFRLEFNVVHVLHRSIYNIYFDI